MIPKLITNIITAQHKAIDAEAQLKAAVLQADKRRTDWLYSMLDPFINEFNESNIWPVYHPIDGTTKFRFTNAQSYGSAAYSRNGEPAKPLRIVRANPAADYVEGLILSETVLTNGGTVEISGYNARPRIIQVTKLEYEVFNPSNALVAKFTYPDEAFSKFLEVWATHFVVRQQEKKPAKKTKKETNDDGK